MQTVSSDEPSPRAAHSCTISRIIFFITPSACIRFAVPLMMLNFYIQKKNSDERSDLDLFVSSKYFHEGYFLRNYRICLECYKIIWRILFVYFTETFIGDIFANRHSIVSLNLVLLSIVSYGRSFKMLCTLFYTICYST